MAGKRVRERWKLFKVVLKARQRERSDDDDNGNNNGSLPDLKRNYIGIYPCWARSASRLLLFHFRFRFRFLSLSLDFQSGSVCDRNVHLALLIRVSHAFVSGS